MSRYILLIDIAIYKLWDIGHITYPLCPSVFSSEIGIEIVLKSWVFLSVVVVLHRLTDNICV